MQARVLNVKMPDKTIKQLGVIPTLTLIEEYKEYCSQNQSIFDCFSSRRDKLEALKSMVPIGNNSLYEETKTLEETFLFETITTQRRLLKTQTFASYSQRTLSEHFSVSNLSHACNLYFSKDQLRKLATFSQTARMLYDSYQHLRIEEIPDCRPANNGSVSQLISGHSSPMLFNEQKQKADENSRNVSIHTISTAVRGPN